MSIEYCFKHDISYDTDFCECSECENEASEILDIANRELLPFKSDKEVLKYTEEDLILVASKYAEQLIKKQIKIEQQD